MLRTVNFCREQLDEVVLAAQNRLQSCRFSFPYCAFNGGSDVWVDLGNKLVGVQVCSFLYVALEFCDQYHSATEHTKLIAGVIAVLEGATTGNSSRWRSISVHWYLTRHTHIPQPATPRHTERDKLI